MKPDFTKIIEYISQKGRTNIFLAAGIIGILLIFLGDIDFSEKEKTSVAENISLQQYKYDTEKELTALLEEIDGVGEVKVMITLESGTENIYVQQEKTANDVRSHQTEGTRQEDTKTTFENEVVVIDEADGNRALIEKTMQPVVQGVAVVCSGADDIKVVSAVTESVSVVLNVPTHKICVTKKR